MAASPSQNFLIPTQTSVPNPHPTSKRKRKYGYPVENQFGPSKMARQVVTDQAQVAAAEQRCQFDSGNYVISCFPTADTVVPQHQWATFVWNSRRPELTQTNLVDIYLFHADSLTQILVFANQTNPSDQAGVLRAKVNDSWWGDNGSNWDGQNISYPYFWVITRNDASLDGSQIPQSTFSAVQTTYADSVMASMSSTSAAAASSASASLHHPSPSSSNGSIQSNSSSSSFPHWAIAVIAFLGFLAIVASCTLAFLMICRARRRNETSTSNRNSMGSASPMMADVGNAPQSPLLAGGLSAQQTSVGHHAPSVVSPDGASTVSRANSADAGPFSGADAAIMADAFRKALRKPDFADQPVEEDSPDSQARKEELLNRELNDEGTGIRNVSSSRGVKVENLSDGGDHSQDFPS